MSPNRSIWFIIRFSLVDCRVQPSARHEGRTRRFADGGVPADLQLAHRRKNGQARGGAIRLVACLLPRPARAIAPPTRPRSHPISLVARSHDAGSRIRNRELARFTINPMITIFRKIRGWNGSRCPAAPQARAANPLAM